MIDTGYPGDTDSILAGVKQAGLQLKDLKHVFLTHVHPDHAGCATSLRDHADFEIYMHPIDAELAREGRALRDTTRAGPGILNKFLYRIFIANVTPSIQPIEVDHEVEDGDKWKRNDDFEFIHIPGHCEGQIAIYWNMHGGVMFAADAAVNVAFLATAPGYEDFAKGRSSLNKIAALEFELACFGHGNPILKSASDKFKRKWLAN